MVVDKDIKDLTVLIDEKKVQEGVLKTAEEINNAFPQDEVLHIICVLKGSIMFFVDLIKHLKMPTQLEFIRLSSYGDDDKSSGRVKSIDMNWPILEGKNILIVEDIVDTGYTAQFLTNILKTEQRPKKLKFAAFLNKECARKVDFEPDFYSYVVDDKFLVGYGLDYKGFYRNLPYVGYFG